MRFLILLQLVTIHSQEQSINTTYCTTLQPLLDPSRWFLRQIQYPFVDKDCKDGNSYCEHTNDRLSKNEATWDYCTERYCRSIEFSILRTGIFRWQTVLIISLIQLTVTLETFWVWGSCPERKLDAAKKVTIMCSKFPPLRFNLTSNKRIVDQRLI